MAYKRDQLLGLSLPGGGIAGFEVHVKQAYHALAALYIDHLYGAIRREQWR
jgi:hypothetical protein